MTEMSVAVFLGALFVVLCLCAPLLYWKFFSDQTEPPGPGILHYVQGLLTKSKPPEIALRELSKKYGSVFSIYYGLRKAVVLTGCKTIKAAHNHKAFSEKNVPQIILDLKLQHGIVFGNGASWKEMRQFTLNNLRQSGAGRREGEEKIMEEVECLLDVIGQTQGKPFNTADVVSLAVSNIICSVVFGNRFEYDDARFQEMVERVHQNSRNLGSLKVQAYNICPMLFRRSKERTELLEGSFANRAHISRLIKDLEESLDPNMSRGLVDSFLLRKKQFEDSGNMNSHYHDDNLQATTINLFAGGTESTSSTIQYGLLLMAKYPEIQDRVQDELERVTGGHPVRADDRKSTPFTQAVIHETQRLLSVFPILIHSTSQDVTFEGYHIKKGTPVIIAMTTALQDETEWEKPRSFNPGHFLDEEGNLISRAAFFPFIEGPRLCVGQNLAKMSLFLIFASLLQRFRFCAPPGVRQEDLDLTRVPGLTYTPSPHQLCAIQRS